MVVHNLDDFKNLVSGVKIPGNNGAAKSRTLVRNKIAFDIATGNDCDNDSALLNQERCVLEPSFRMVVQEFASLQKCPVHGFFHDESVPARFFFGAVGQNFVHIS
jgi:hypothetical protein